MTLQWAPITRDVVAVEGPDAASFLQGQVSQDVLGLAPGASAWTFVLAPAGKVDGFARVHRAEDERFVLDTEPGFGDALVARLQRFKLRVKAELQLLPAVPAVALRGDGAAAVPGALVGWWAAPDAADLVGDAAPPAGTAAIGRDDLERLRMETGWPAMGAELTEETIPAEAGVVPVAVSFTKGCFTGQELVARIDSRGGHVPRHLRRLRAATGAIAAGARLLSGGKDVGWVTSTAGDVALGYVGRAIEPAAIVTADGAEVTVEAITPSV